MKYIKYKRIEKYCNTAEEIQKFFDELITEGYEIITYSEKKESHDNRKFFFSVIVTVGKLRIVDKPIIL